MPMMYPYPDGTTGTARPTDGQIFIEWDKNNNPVDQWMWDDMLGQWYRVTANKPVTPPPPGAVRWFLDKKEVSEILVAKCECGAEAVGSSGHSSWCGKFTTQS